MATQEQHTMNQNFWGRVFLKQALVQKTKYDIRQKQTEFVKYIYNSSLAILSGFFVAKDIIGLVM
jgi:hypothetical protein